MNQVKSRLAALALLDRAMATLPDDELQGLVDSLEGELATAYGQVIGRADDEETSVVEHTREACHRGRINGTLERVAAVLSDRCLADCIEQLGEAADAPSDEELGAVLPGLVERHGLATVRLMLASAVAGEAAAAPACIRLLKHDETFALPPAPPAAPRSAPAPEDEAERAAVREKRKADRLRKQLEQKARRDQAAAAKKK